MENEEKYKMLKKGRNICVYTQQLPVAFAYSAVAANIYLTVGDISVLYSCHSVHRPFLCVAATQCCFSNYVSIQL